MSERWCEHMDSQKLDSLLLKVFASEMQTQYCPACGEKRPETNKSLHKKLRCVYDNSSDSSTVWESLATCALEHFVAIVDKHSYSVKHGNEFLLKEELKQAMRGSLNG